MAWDNNGSDIPPTYDIIIDNCIEEMQRAGAEFSWAGMVHTESVNLVTHITGLGCTSARTVAINIQTHINDTIVEIHQAARDMKRPNAPTPATYTLEEQEDQLDALDLLLTGAETIQQYRASHINRRRNTVNKRLKLRGDAVDYLPPIGSEIRTYAQGACLETQITGYDMQTNECKLSMTGSEMTLTTSIEKASRSAVRKDGFTSDEIAVVNHSVEWLEHTHDEHTWKHYGTVAQITLIEGEPHALIIRSTDAQTEHQPLKDVIEGDTIRLGKQIGNRRRGRERTRHGHKHSRGHASKRTKLHRKGDRWSPTPNEGSSQPPKTHTPNEGNVRLPKSNINETGKTTGSHMSSSTQGNNRRATQQQPNGPGNRTADGKRNGARPGKTTPADHSGKHRRPAKKVAGGRQTGDVAAPND